MCIVSTFLRKQKLCAVSILHAKHLEVCVCVRVCGLEVGAESLSRLLTDRENNTTPPRQAECRKPLSRQLVSHWFIAVMTRRRRGTSSSPRGSTSSASPATCTYTGMFTAVHAGFRSQQFLSGAGLQGGRCWRRTNIRLCGANAGSQRSTPWHMSACSVTS